MKYGFLESKWRNLSAHRTLKMNLDHLLRNNQPDERNSESSISLIVFYLHRYTSSVIASVGTAINLNICPVSDDCRTHRETKIHRLTQAVSSQVDTVASR